MGYDVPTAYAQLIGPRYGVIADRLLEAACVNRDDDVLEVGAGTGVVTVRAAPMARSVVATDLSGSDARERKTVALRRSERLIPRRGLRFPASISPQVVHAGAERPDVRAGLIE